MQLELGVKGLQCQSEGSIGFLSHQLQCVKEPPALAGEESIGGETCDRGHGTCKFIG